MGHGIVIRDETASDINAITDVTLAAFKTLKISNLTEPGIMIGLRSAGALTVSLVAELDGRIVGHVAFSPVTVSDGTPGWYGLGPVSVAPEYHRQGIGGALIREGLARLQARGARGCCLVGHPEYYGRFGFVHPDGLGEEGVPAHVFFALAFDGEMPRGTVTFHQAFAQAE
jgi:putative acetyltransferase